MDSSSSSSGSWGAAARASVALDGSSGGSLGAQQQACVDYIAQASGMSRQLAAGVLQKATSLGFVRDDAVGG